MPQIIAWAASAIANAIFAPAIVATTTTVGGITTLTATTVATTAATVTAAVLETAAYAAIGALAAPQVAAAKGMPTEWTADPRAPIPFVSGLRGTAGVIRKRGAYGPDNRYEGIVTVYSGGGPINAYGTFYVDDTARTFTGEVMNGTPINSLYRQTKLGNQPDTVLTSPSVPGGYTLTGWTSAHKLSGKACSMITLFQDGNFKRWPTGEPRVIQEIQGLLAWDPRLDSTWPGGSGSCRLATPSTWVYSTNPIIHALKWALGIRENSILVGGIGADVEAIDVSSFIAAANVADTNGWTVSAVAYSLDDKSEVFRAYLQAGGCVPARTAGKISCLSRVASPSSVYTFTADDTAGPFELEAGAPRESRINTAIPNCVQSAHGWENVDLAPVSSSTYVTEDDGATRSRGVPLPFVSDETQATQLTAYEIANSREWPVSTIPFKPYMRDVALGDAITGNEEEFGLVGQKFLVVGRSYDAKSDIVTLSVVTETAAKHAWALGKSGTSPSSPSLGYTDPNTVPTPSTSDWTLAAGSGGVPSIVITGAVPSTVTVSAIVVEYKTVAGATWILAGEYNTDTVKVEIPGATAATAYTARVSYRNIYGVTGSTQTLSATPTTGTVAGGGVTAGTIDSTQLADNAVTTAKIAAAAISTANFASGIEPVTIVSSVPGAKSTETVFNTTDRKLYRWNGSSYIATLATTDLSGTITAAQIANAALTTAKFAAGIEPVTIVSSVPGTKSTETIFNTADRKQYRWNGSSYVATIATSDLSGTVSDAQIAGLAASKITGTLTNSQIADLAAAKLTGQITTTQITDNSVTTAKVNAGAITTAKIAADAVTATEIAAGAVTATEIAAGAITTAKLAAGAVTAAEIAAGAVTAGKIAAGAIVAADIAADTITAGQIAAGAISASELAAGAVTTAKLAAGAVTANEIASNAITAGKIAAGAIVAADIATDTITSGQIAAGAISTSELAAGAVTAAKIAAGTITATEIAASTITAGKLNITDLSAISANLGSISVGSANITDLAVTTIKINGDAVTTDKILTGAVHRLSADQTAGTGANCVNRSGASDPSKRALVKSYNFTVDSTGKVSIQFLTHVELKSSNRLYFYMKVTSEAAATWTTDNVMTNADLSWEFQASNNDRLPSTGVKVFASGLTPGAATVEVYWNDGGSGAHNHECNNPVFEIKEFKKAA